MENLEINIDTDLLNKYGDDYIDIITKVLIDNDKVSTGELIKSLKYDLRETAEEIYFKITSKDYLTYIDQGRKPGSYPNINAIKEWTNLKGIPETAVFPIAQSIYNIGIPATDILDKSIRKIEDLTVNDLEDYLSTDFEDQIVNKIENINK